jgi:hypothetical protein
MTHANDDNDDRAPAENPAVADIRAKWAADPSAAKSRRECMAIGKWQMTTQLTKEKRGLLLTYVDGGMVRVTTDSLYRHLVDLASAPLRKVRRPTSGFKRRRRTPTPQELNALERANEARAAEARARREAEVRRKAKRPRGSAKQSESEKELA